jgi:hypothetical protein
MADITLSATTGLTVTIQLYLANLTEGSPFTMSEIGATGEYYASMPGGLSAGDYMLLFKAGGVKIASGYMSWDGTRELHDTWDAYQSNYGRPGSYGYTFETNLDAAISTRATPSDIPAAPSVPSAASNASATVSALNATTIPVNVKKVNDVSLTGTGEVDDPWSPV